MSHTSPPTKCFWTSHYCDNQTSINIFSVSLESETRWYWAINFIEARLLLLDICFKYHEGFTGHIVWDNLSLFWLHSIPNFGLITFRPFQVSSLQYRHDLSLEWSSQMWKTDCRKYLPKTVTPMQIWVWRNILWNIEGRLPGLIIIILTLKSDYPSTTVERRLLKAHTFNKFCQRKLYSVLSKKTNKRLRL